jgi:hypothetical protein
MQQTILLTNQLATGSAFALTESNENVFIPSKVMFGHSVRLGQRVQAVCVPNMTRPDRTPWLAVSILDAEPVQQEVGRPSPDALDEMILDLIEDDGRLTVQEITTFLNMELATNLSDIDVASRLFELVASGHVVRVVCYDLPEEDA